MRGRAGPSNRALVGPFSCPGSRRLMRLRIVALAVTLAALADLVGGCVAPSGKAPATSPSAVAVARTDPPGRSASPAADGDALIVHVLNRLGYGPRPGDLERVRAMGLETYVERQL